MAGVDSSLYSSYMAAQPNPLQQGQQGIGLLSALQGYQAKMAGGKALQEATDQSGNVDYNRAINNMARDPQGQYGLSDFVNEQIANQRISAATGAQMLQNTGELQSLISKTASSMASNQNLQDGDIVNGISSLWSEMHATGLADKYPHAMDALINIIPQLQGLPNESGVNRNNPLQPGFNPQARSKQQVLSQMSIQGQSAADAAQMAYGNLIQQNTGANISTSAVSPLPGVAPRQVGNTPVQIPPTAMQPTVGPGGLPGEVPLASAVGQPPTGIQPAGQTQNSGPTPPATPGSAPFVPSALSPVKQAAYGQFNTEFSQAKEALSNSQQAMVQLKEAEGLLSSVKPGGGAEFRAKFGQVLQGLQDTIPGLHIPQSVIDGASNGNLGSSQEFMKLAYWNAMQQLGQNVGRGHISTFETQMAASRNPSLDTDPRAIIKMNDLTNHMFQMLQKKVKAMTFANNQFDNAQTADDYRPVVNFDSDWNDYLSKQGWTNITPEAQAARKKLWGDVPQ